MPVSLMTNSCKLSSLLRVLQIIEEFDGSVDHGIPQLSDAPPRTYGSLHLAKNRKTWVVECEPHVAIRLKRVFPKARPSQKKIILSATPETTEELQWFLERFPLQISANDHAALHELANEYLDRRRQVAQIITSGGRLEAPKMAIPPRPYQVAASELCYVTGRLLCADELGLGKTVSALSLLARPGALPAAIVVPTHLPTQWAREIEKFLPGTTTYVVKTTNPTKEKPPDGVDIWIVPYSRLSGCAHYLQTRIRSVIFDEVHELRREGSNKYSGAQTLSSDVSYRCGLTATPIWNYGGEFYSVLGIVAPGELGTWEEFTREWCASFHDPRKAQIKDPIAFGSWLRDQGVMLRRTRREVGRQLPPIVRSVIEVEWNEDPLRDVDAAMVELATKVLTGQGREKFLAAGDLDARVRQATGLAKASAVAALVRTIIESSEEPVVLFGWHRAVYDIWLSALADFQPVLYTGSEKAKEKDSHLQKFISGESKVLIMSLRSGSGIDGLQDMCRRVVVGELDWSPGALEQCVGRVHRDGQKDPTMVYYPVVDTGSDPIMLDVLDLKRWQSDGVVDPGGERVLDIQIDPTHIKRLAENLLLKRNISLPEQVDETAEVREIISEVPHAGC